MAHEVFEATPMVRSTDERPSVLIGTHRARRGLDLVAALALVVVALAVAVRVAFLHNQSYWSDETFSVSQASETLGHVFDVGRTEIHTPLNAFLLWCWERLGGSTTLWTHSLSALFGLGAVVASYTGLRAAGLSDRARWLAVALTAGSGFGIVYAQESRPYSLVLLGATGLTAATVRQLATLAGVVDAPAHRWRRPAGWTAWALLTSAAHLLGAVLVGVMALALAVAAWRRRGTRESLLALGLGALALAPQLAWVAAGTGRSGFAAGTTWIPAPGGGDVWVLLTTVFSAGGLQPRADGFAWTSAAGVAVVVVLLLVAGALRLRGRGRAGEADQSSFAATHARADGPGGLGAEAVVRDLRLGLTLLAVAAATLVGVFLLSQVVHIWTLRNMIVTVPALTWGLAWVVTALPAREGQRRALAVVVLVATLVSLGAVANDLRHPYKTDWRGLLRYLAQERAAEPAATFSFFGGSALGQVAAADQGPVPDAALKRIERRMERYPRTAAAISRLRRTGGPHVVVYYPGVGHPQSDDIADAIRRRLADPSCRRVPIYGLVVFSCP